MHKVARTEESSRCEGPEGGNAVQSWQLVKPKNKARRTLLHFPLVTVTRSLCLFESLRDFHSRSTQSRIKRSSQYRQNRQSKRLNHRTIRDDKWKIEPCKGRAVSRSLQQEQSSRNSEEETE